MQKEIIRLSEKYPRYGYRRVTGAPTATMMRREGYIINENRILRVRREAGLIGCVKSSGGRAALGFRAFGDARQRSAEMCGAGTL